MRDDRPVGQWLPYRDQPTRPPPDRAANLAGDALQPVHTATTLRMRDGKVSITDGPFAETKEQLAGFYMLEATNLDEALKLAAKIPPARVGSIEVRPVRQLVPKAANRK